VEIILIVLGATIFGLLGAVHLFYTFFTNKFDAYDAKVTEAMKNTSPILTRDTTLWAAWVGFNASHSLGALLFSAIYIPLCLFHSEVIEQSWWFAWLPVLIGLSYLLLARKYWFKAPLIGILFSTAAFTVAALLLTLR